MARSFKRLMPLPRGMTLLELLVVMVILGILATIGTLQVVGYLDRSRSDAARLQMEQISSAIDLFSIDMGRVPSTVEGIQALLTAPQSDLQGWRGPYITRSASLKDPWGHVFIYQSPGKDRKFELFSLGSDGIQGGSGNNSDIVYDRN